MTDPNKFSIIAGPGHAVISIGEPDGLLARGLNAIQDRNMKTLSLFSDEEACKSFRAACSRYDYDHALQIVHFLADRHRALAEELCFEFCAEARPDDCNDSECFARAQRCKICLRNAAERGDSFAQDILAWHYYPEEWEGASSPEDSAEALKWARRAAEQGRMRSQFILGKMYCEGKHGIARNYGEAMRWFQKSAAHRYDISILVCVYYEIGEMYYRGQGGPIDYRGALMMYQNVIEQRLPGREIIEALLRLGEMYYEGKGTIVDYVQAYKWFARVRKWTRLDLGSTRLCDEIAAKMSPEQLAEALKLAQE